MNMSLGERLEHAKSMRALLQARVSAFVASEVAHDPYLAGAPDDEGMPDDLSEDALFPCLRVFGPRHSMISVEFLPRRIVIRSPKRLGHGGREATHVIPIGEGIGGRMVVEETDDHIVERIVGKLADLHRRAGVRDLRHVRRELAALKKREAQLAAVVNGAQGH